MNDDLATLIREIRDLRAVIESLPTALVAVLNARRQSAALTRTDRAALAALLPAIAAGRRTEVEFTATEALAHVQGTPGVVAAVHQAIGPNDSGAARRLGKLFARTEGTAVDGLIVSRTGNVRDGALWSVMRV